MYPLASRNFEGDKKKSCQRSKLEEDFSRAACLQDKPFTEHES
jgi:hypothetical protein